MKPENLLDQEITLEQLFERDERITELEEENEVLSIRTELAERKLASSNELVTRFSNENKMLSDSYQEIKQRLSNAIELSSERYENNKKLTKQYAQKNKACLKNHLKVKDLESKLEDMTNERDILYSLYNGLKITIDSRVGIGLSNAQTEKLLDQIKTLKIKLDNAQATNSYRLEESQSLLAELRALEDKYNELEDKYEGLQIKDVITTHNYNALLDLYSDLQDQANALTDKLNELKEENNQLKDKYKQLVNENNGYKSDLLNFTRAFDSVKDLINKWN